MTTHIPKVREADRKWFVLDARDQVLGKLATTAAVILTGKNKPIYTPFLDTGDHVIVINAAQVHLTGRKPEGKLYRHHTGYMGGLKTVAAGDLIRKSPVKVVEEAVRGMLPKTKLGRSMFHKLKVYAGDKHPHQAQKPQALAVKERKKR
ncbi:MAG: 50S ribosomal protein L13 [Acidobacteria bacterium]|nr:MAG: 50S ribosomal protein L13 [Acidobacteriota bacterium]